jgi:hypothetical protein
MIFTSAFLISFLILLLLNYQLSLEENFRLINMVVDNTYFRDFPKEYTLLFDYKIQRAFNFAFILYTLYYLQKKKSNVLMKPKIAKMICAFPHILYIIYASLKSPLQADLAFRLPTDNYTNNLEIFYLN